MEPGYFGVCDNSTILILYEARSIIVFSYYDISNKINYFQDEKQNNQDITAASDHILSTILNQSYLPLALINTLMNRNVLY